MKRQLKIFFTALKLAMAQRMAYRTNFFISFFFNIVTSLIFPFITFIIYSSGSTFPGWNLYEVLVLQGMFSVTTGLALILFGGMLFNVLIGVREGTFDMLLLRPLPAAFTAVITGFNLEEGGSVLTGLLLIFLALGRLPPAGVWQWLQCGCLLLPALLVMLSLSLILAGTLFVWVGNSRLWEIFDVVTNFGRYPASIYSVVVRTIITAILPVAMIAFFPAAALLGKLQAGMLLPAAVTAGFFGFSLFFWHKMLARYTSAGG